VTMEEFFASYRLSRSRFCLKILGLIEPLRVLGDTTECVRRFREIVPLGWEFIPLPVNASHSCTVLFKGAENNLVVSAGTEGTTHFSRVLEGYNQRITDPNDWHASPGFAAAARAIRDECPARWWIGAGKWHLCGHSFGGATMAALASMLLDSGVQHELHVQSFGAPRPGGQQLQQILTTVDFRRWYTIEDPVVLVPPHTDEAPLLQIGVSNVVALEINRQVQPRGGIMMNTDGSVEYRENGPVVVRDIESNLLGWLASGTGLANNYHALSLYTSRMRALVQRETQDAPKERGTPGTLRSREQVAPPEEPLRATIRQRAGMVEAAVADLGGQPFPPAGLPRIPPKPGLRYKTKKQSGVWTVVYDGSVVAIGPGKRQAMKISRAGNRTLRSLPMVGNPVPVEI